MPPERGRCGVELGPVLTSVREMGQELGRDLGEFIRDQRTAAQLSVRALAERAGVSNPYLSQVERGLRRPSAAILARIAEGLSLSTETLLTRAGLLPEREQPTGGVEAAVLADPRLTPRQQQLLLETYRMFTENTPAPTTAAPTVSEPTTAAPTTAAPTSSPTPEEEHHDD